jgi:hypothetical protein
MMPGRRSGGKKFDGRLSTPGNISYFPAPSKTTNA